MREKVIITGPTGAVGIALMQKCLDEQCEILAICHRGSPRNEQVPKNPLITVIEADLEELDKIDPVQYMGYNTFYHLAWCGTYGDDRDNIALQLKNIECTLHAVELAAAMGCHTFIGVGSQAEYGRTECDLNSSTPTFPENGYGIAKLCAGQMSRVLCRQKGMRHIWARILSVYGPYDRSETLVSSTLIKMLNKEETYFTGGEQIWDFIYSEDAAAALYALGVKGRDGQVYCIGNGQGLPLRDYIMKMKRAAACDMQVHFGAIPYTDKQVMYLCADIEALKKDTGFMPSINFDTGIRKTIEWVKKYEKDKLSDTVL